MYAPDVWETTESEVRYDELRKRADELGFPTVHDALDALQKLMDWGKPH